MVDFMSLYESGNTLAICVGTILAAALGSPLTDALVVALKAVEQGLAKLFHKDWEINANIYALAVAALITVAGWIGTEYDVMDSVNTIFDFLYRAAPLTASVITLFLGQKATYASAKVLNFPLLNYQRSGDDKKAA